MATGFEFNYIPLESRPKRSKTNIAFVQLRDRNICQCCYVTSLKDKLEVHHIHPLWCGGEDEQNNMIVLCSECHKYAPDDWRDFLDYQRYGGRSGQLFAGEELLKSLHIYPEMTLGEFSKFLHSFRMNVFQYNWHHSENLEKVRTKEILQLESAQKKEQILSFLKKKSGEWVAMSDLNKSEIKDIFSSHRIQWLIDHGMVETKLASIGSRTKRFYRAII